MIEFNDSNANYSQNGVSVFTEMVETDEDIYISSSCIFLSNVISSGTIRAQYNLIVYGKLSAGGDIEIGGELQCEQVKGNSINIGGRITTKEEIACNNLFVTGDAIIGAAYCDNIEVNGTLVSTGMVDAAESIKIGKSLVSLDFVQASKGVSAAEVIAAEFRAEKENIGTKVLLSKGSALESTLTTSGSISDSEISDIFDAQSPLAIEIDDCAVFLEQLNQELSSLQYNDEKLRNYLAAFGGFFPSYTDLLDVIDSVSSILSEDTIDDESWFDAFNTTVAAISRLPSWFTESEVARSLHGKILDLLSYQSSHVISAKSFTAWTYANYHAKLLHELYKDNQVVLSQLEHFNELLLSTISLKPPFIKLLFTQE